MFVFTVVFSEKNIFLRFVFLIQTGVCQYRFPYSFRASAVHLEIKSVFASVYASRLCSCCFQSRRFNVSYSFATTGCSLTHPMSYRIIFFSCQKPPRILICLLYTNVYSAAFVSSTSSPLSVNSSRVKPIPFLSIHISKMQR